MNWGGNGRGIFEDRPIKITENSNYSLSSGRTHLGHYC